MLDLGAELQYDICHFPDDIISLETKNCVFVVLDVAVFASCMPLPLAPHGRDYDTRRGGEDTSRGGKKIEIRRGAGRLLSAVVCLQGSVRRGVVQLVAICSSPASKFLHICIG